MWYFGWVIIRNLCDQLKIGSFITKYKGEESGHWEAFISISVSVIKSWRRNGQRDRRTQENVMFLNPNDYLVSKEKPSSLPMVPRAQEDEAH